MGTAAPEFDARACHKILDRARDEHRAWVGERFDARTNVDRDATDVVPHHLALPRVEPGAHIDTKLVYGGGDTTGATNRSSRAVERGEEAVSLGANLPPTPARELPPTHTVVHLKQFSPTTIAQRGRAFRRSDDVSEQDGREDAF